MFELQAAEADDYEADDATRCAEALVASIAAERREVARRFALVAAWADLHCPEPVQDDPADGLSVRRRLEARAQTNVGAEGTPRVSRAGVLELGMLLEVSPGTALALLRDVLELRHRLPRHWEAIQELRLDGWKGRQVATMTHRLTEQQARAVDPMVIDAVLGLPWGRAKDAVEGKVIAVDRVAHAARLAEDENRRFVSTRRGSNVAGLRTMIARGHAGDIARLEAIVSHLAERLKAAGDGSHVDLRRAKALAMLANPALVCAFLAQADAPTAQVDAPSAQQELFEPASPDSAGADGLPSAVELAVAFGHVLHRLGGKALDRLRPKSVLYLHLAAEAVRGRRSCGVVRVDDAVAAGPISVDQLKAWLGHDRVTVKPVIDPTGIEPVSAYEIPLQMREASRLLNPLETSPWGTLSTRDADQDHVTPYVPMNKGGPPGQTALTNLGPLGRTRHLAKTFDGFVVHQLALGLYLWRSPTGHWFQVDHRGTRPLGRLTGQASPPALDTARRLATTGTADTSGMTQAEKHFREAIIRHVAA